MREGIRLIDEALSISDPHCTLCESPQTPFLALPVPAQLVALVEVGEWLICPSCFEGMCAAGGVVSTGRFEAVLERASEAEQRLVTLEAQAKTATKTIAKLEQDLRNMEGRAVGAEGQAAAALRRVEELLADPAVQARELLKQRLEAAAEPKTRRRKVAA